MLDAEIRTRVRRLLEGEPRSADLDRIFLSLRPRSHGRDSVREIGDFVAHREEREKGAVTRRAQDILISARAWTRGLLGETPDPATIAEVAAANLRTATDEQLNIRTGLRRQVVGSVLAQGLKKLERRAELTIREQMVIAYLGGAFIWNPVFTDVQLAGDLLHVLGRCGLLPSGSRPEPADFLPFLSLYAVALMHGSALRFADGQKADLRSEHTNKEDLLEVKAMLPVTKQPKTVQASVCMFWTTLRAVEHCSGRVMNEPHLWNGPLDIDGQGKLGPA